MPNGNGFNGKGKWLFGALGTIAVFVGLLVTYGRTHGSESATVQRNAEDIATLQNHDLEEHRILMGVAASVSAVAMDVAVTKNDVEWIKDNFQLVMDKMNKENENND